MQCDYCQSLVFTEKNPLVVDRIVPMGQTLEAAACPSCDCVLSTGKIEDRPVLYCGQCFGVLIKNEVFGAVVRERRARRKGRETGVCKPLDTSAYDRILGCPACERKVESIRIMVPAMWPSIHAVRVSTSGWIMVSFVLWSEPKVPLSESLCLCMLKTTERSQLSPSPNRHATSLKNRICKASPTLFSECKTGARADLIFRYHLWPLSGVRTN